MRQFFYPSAPLSRGTLLFCHAVLQLGVLVAGLWWLIPRTPWMTAASWADAWPPLVIGLGIMLLVMVALRLVAELWLLPHHLANQRAGFSASAVVTRSFERRPAVHDNEQAWTSQGQVMNDDSAAGTARVKRRAETLAQRRQREPELNVDASNTGNDNDPGRREPSL